MAKPPESGKKGLEFVSWNSERPIELPKYYVEGQELDDESRTLEFKECGKCPIPEEFYKKNIAKYVCGFFNTVGGTLMLGVTDNGKVNGVKLSHKERDDMRKDVDRAMEKIKPLVDTGTCPLDFIPVRPKGVEEIVKSEGLPAADKDRYVVCLSVPKREKGVMYFAGNDAFVKRNGELKKLEGSEVRDFTHKVQKEVEELRKVRGQLTVSDIPSKFQLLTTTPETGLSTRSKMLPMATNVPLDLPVSIDELPDSLDSYDTTTSTGQLQVVQELIGPLGGVLDLKSRGITMSIPAGALDCIKNMTLKALTQPPDVCDKEDEMVVSLGYECSPSGLDFGKPVMISFPHAALFHDPEQVETILYSGHGKYRKDDTDVERIPLSRLDGVPRCIVRENLMELYVGHLSWGWLTALVNRRNVRGKRIGCVPFMPRELPSNHVPILRVHFFMITKSDRNPVERISNVEGGLGNTLSAVEQMVDAAVGTKELVIRCQSNEGESEAQVKILQHKWLKRLVQKTIYFAIDLSSTPFANKLLSLSLQQAISMDFLFWTKYKVIPVETEDLRATGRDSSSDDGDISQLLSDIAYDIENDEQMNRLGRALEIERPALVRYGGSNLMGGRVTFRGTEDMLHAWRQTVHRDQQLTVLRAALERARLLDILDKHLPT